VFAIQAGKGTGEGRGETIAEVGSFFGGVGEAGRGIFAGCAVGADGCSCGEPGEGSLGHG
jgi:hypothetical protein